MSTLALLAACGGGTAPVDAGVTETDAGTTAPDAGLVADAGAVADAVAADAGAADAGEAAATWSEVQAILQANCSPCHDPNNARRRTVVREYDNLVNATSGQFTLVAPGDVEGSFLYAKVTGETAAYCQAQGSSARNCGGIMPPAPRTPLDAAQLETIRGWIAGGALP